MFVRGNYCKKVVAPLFYAKEGGIVTMSDEPTQASDGPVAITDNPSAPDTEAVEKGSTGSAPVQDHRDVLAELDKLDPKTLFNHPLVKGELARRTKSAQDQAYYRGRQAALTEAEKQHREIEAGRLIEEGDEYEIGRRTKEEYRRRKELEPILQQAREEAFQQGHSQGYTSGLGELGAALQELPHWKAMSREEQAAFYDDAGAPREFLHKVLHEGISRGMNAELKKIQEKQVQEDEVEARSNASSPVVSVGSHAAAFKDADAIHRAYSEGQLGIKGDLYGDVARKRYVEALARFGETP